MIIAIPQRSPEHHMNVYRDLTCLSILFQRLSNLLYRLYIFCHLPSSVYKATEVDQYIILCRISFSNMFLKPVPSLESGMNRLA